MQIFEGEVACVNKNSIPSIAIDSSLWFFYGKQKEPIPVSKTYLVKKLGVSFSFLSNAEKITAKTTPIQLNEIMGPETKFTSLTGNSEWIFSEGFKKLSVLKMGSCITKVKLTGDPMSILASMQEKKQTDSKPERFDTYISPDFYYLALNKDC